VENFSFCPITPGVAGKKCIMENENKFQTTTVQPLVDTNELVGEIVVGVLSGLALVAGLGFMVFMVGKAVFDDAKSSGKWEGRREAEKEAEAEAERTAARHRREAEADAELHKSEVDYQRARADQLEKELDKLRD
jgi:polyhydroxyalkanoate synthesis regulator phasin